MFATDGTSKLVPFPPTLGTTSKLVLFPNANTARARTPLRQAQGRLSRQPAGPFDSAQGGLPALRSFFWSSFLTFGSRVNQCLPAADTSLFDS